MIERMVYGQVTPWADHASGRPSQGLELPKTKSSRRWGLFDGKLDTDRLEATQRPQAVKRHHTLTVQYPKSCSEQIGMMGWAWLMGCGGSSPVG